jgi:hypothetical protein
VVVEPSWLTPEVISLTRTIHEERAFERMPILGDAFEDSGCGNDAVLDHCRRGEGHARGCWVVDLLLGKA